MQIFNLYKKKDNNKKIEEQFENHQESGLIL